MIGRLLSRASRTRRRELPQLGVRLQLARAALVWERAWPAAWPAVLLLGVFLVAALFDVLPALPGEAHAGVLALLALAFMAAVAWGVYTARGGAWPDRLAARRRLEAASGLTHRPLQALADRPSEPLDGPAAALWAAHQRRMAAMIGRLRVGWPAAGLARRDPWGVRSVLAILLLLGAIDAGGDWRERLQRAVTPAFASGPAAAAASFDLWLTPPDYTGRPPVFLRAGNSATVAVPTGSTLLAQVHGGDGLPRLAIDGKAHDFTAVDKDNFRFESKLTAGKDIALRQDGETLGHWPITIVPDRPPAVAFARPPSATPRAALRLDYTAGDDYGVESVTAVIRRQDHKGGAPIVLDLPLPGLHLKTATATSYHDLSPNPWAGLPVEIRLVAKDALGQTGKSAPVRMILPERVFRNPVARAIIDQRKELVKDPGSAAAVAEILGDLNLKPGRYHDDAVVYLALRFAQDRLRREHGTAMLAQVEQLMWDTALRIEDGNMSLAEREMRRLQNQLQDALARGAPDAEIERRIQQLRDAIDRYMQALAEDMQRHPDRMTTPFDSSRVMTRRDIDRLLDRARELARSGDREAARKLLSELQNTLENLRAARPDQRQQRSASQAQQMMRGLERMMQQQQRLLDRSFRARRRESELGQPGGQQRQAGRPAQQPGAGQLGENGDEAEQQEALRHGLGDMMRQLGERLGEIPQSLGRAERAMRDAAGALQRGRPGDAIMPQSEALDQLQEGARDFAQRLQQRLGKTGQPNPDAIGAIPNGGRDRTERDPFGRPLSSDGTFDQSDVKIPADNILQKSRRILDELRRRAGERSRPAIELDYIDRLLKRF